MKPNMSMGERIIRVVIGIAIIAWGIVAKNWWGALGIVPLATGIIGWCGLYQIFNIKCCPSSKMKKDGGSNSSDSTSCCCSKH